MNTINIDTGRVNTHVLPNINKTGSYLDRAKFNSNMLKKMLPKDYNHINSVNNIDSQLVSLKADNDSIGSKVEEKALEADNIETKNSNKADSLFSGIIGLFSSESKNEEKSKNKKKENKDNSIEEIMNSQVRPTIEGILSELGVDPKIKAIIVDTIIDYLHTFSKAQLAVMGLTVKLHDYPLSGKETIELLNRLEEQNVPIGDIVLLALKKYVTNIQINLDTKTIDRFLDYFKDYPNDLDTLITAFTSENESVLGTFRNLLPVIIRMGREMNLKYDDLVAIVPDLPNIVIEKADSVFSQLGFSSRITEDNLEQLVNALIYDEGDDLYEKVVSALPYLKKDLAKLIWDQPIVAIDPNSPEMTRLLKHFFENIDTSLEYLDEALTLNQDGASIWDQTMAWFKLYKYLDPGLGGHISIGAAITAKGVTSIGQKIGGWIEDAGTFVSSGASSLWEKFSSTKFGRKVNSGFSKLANKASNIWDDFESSKVGGTIVSGVNSFINGAEYYGGKAKDWLEDTGAYISEKATDTWYSITEGLSDFGDWVGSLW